MSDRTVPTPLSAAKLANFWRQSASQLVPASASTNAPAGRRFVDVRETVFQNRHQTQIEFADKLPNSRLSFVDKIRARFCVLAKPIRIAACKNPPADSRSRLNDGDSGALLRQFPRGDQTGEASAGDQHLHTAE